jgi:hypothetical protein
LGAYTRRVLARKRAIYPRLRDGARRLPLVPSAASSGRVFVAKLLADAPPPAPTELACPPAPRRLAPGDDRTAHAPHPPPSTLHAPRSTCHAPRATPHSSAARARARAVLLCCRLSEPLHQASQHRRHAARDALELLSVVPPADVHREQQVPSSGHFRTLAAALRESLALRCGAPAVRSLREQQDSVRRRPQKVIGDVARTARNLCCDLVAHHRGRARARAGEGWSVGRGRGSWAWGVSSWLSGRITGSSASGFPGPISDGRNECVAGGRARGESLFNRGPA